MMAPMRILTLFEIVLLLSSGSPAIAQRMFLDTNGDGEASADDVLARGKQEYVTVWVETNARGGTGPCAAKSVGDDLLTINSYEFILHADGGQVKWGKFTNHQPTMNVQLGPYSNENDYYIGQMGMERLVAGKYRLGTLEVSVVSGNPTLALVDRSPAWQGAATSFGSQYSGIDGDNTLKLTGSSPGKGETSSPRGDWSATAGLRTSASANAGEIELSRNAELRFGVRLFQNTGRAGTQLRVTTGQPGWLRVRLYDVSGRLIRVVADHSNLAQGEHVFSINSDQSGGARMAAAIYYFRVECPEGTRTGKIAIVR